VDGGRADGCADVHPPGRWNVGLAAHEPLPSAQHHRQPGRPGRHLCLVRLRLGERPLRTTGYGVRRRCMRAIDIHAHLTPRCFQREVLAGRTWHGMTSAEGELFNPMNAWTPEQRLAEMRSLGGRRPGGVHQRRLLQIRSRRRYHHGHRASL
jgi:hypothetical protein